jgi:SAM dependent carboxyl methyltransferase
MTTTTTTSEKISDAATHTMKSKPYHDHSIHQYEAHNKCQHLLEGALHRLAKRIFLESTRDACDLPQQQQRRQRRHLVDCGSADGSNSMRTLQWAVWTLQQALMTHHHHQQQQQQQHDTVVPLKVTFEEHPASDYQFLQSTLAEYDDWFRANDIEKSILMKSFYEPLFEPESVDLLLCYICLHWLDTTDDSSKGNVREWKSLGLLGGGETKTESSHTALTTSFTFMNESTVPTILKQHYATMAKRHLAKFLALRARELRPGAEMILMMVSQPNDFVVSSPKTGNRRSNSVLTEAMQRCVRLGLLREHVLEQTLVPYYLRTTQDVRDAVELAATIDLGSTGDGSTTRPGALLALVGDVETYSVRIGDHAEHGSNIQGAFDMFWSIHAGAVEGGGATDAEMGAVCRETQAVFHEVFSSQEGVNITFLACLIRKRTRESWTTAAQNDPGQR